MYRTVAAEASSELTVARSVFLARLHEASNEEEARAFLAKVKKEIPGADHYCYAYRLGENGSTSHSSDGGEPGGTAGRPILEAMLASGVTDAVLVVARHFGGRKLGIPGLIEAYRRSAEGVLANAVMTEKERTRTLELRLSYRQLDPARRLLKKYGITELRASYTSAVSLLLEVPVAAEDDLRTELAGLRIEPGNLRVT